jgi:CBS domain containing-hemolysin-like protein
LDPSSCTAPDGRPPPAAAWLVVGLIPLLADVTAAEVAVRLVAVGVLLAVAAALAITEATRGRRTGAWGEAAFAGDPRSAWLLERRRPALVGIRLLSALAVVGAALITLPLLHELAVVVGAGPAVSRAIGLVVLCLIWLIAGVAIPRARANAPGWAAAGVAVSFPLIRSVLPLANVLTRALSSIRARNGGVEEPISAEDVRGMAGAREEGEPLGEDEAALIHSILEFGDTTVREVMVARVDMVALPDSATLDDALALIREAGHSRFPLYGRDLDDIKGVVYAKDLLPLAVPGRDGGGAVDWPRLARRARIVPPGRNLDDLLADFQSQRTHLAVVVDEHGGTLGLVTLEDLLEEVVGEIRDELDDPEDAPRVLSVGPDTYRVDARLDLDAFFAALEMEVDTDEFGFETLGGLVFHLAGSVPDEGDEVVFENLVLRVETLDANRIREVTVTRSEPNGAT